MISDRPEGPGMKEAYNSCVDANSIPSVVDSPSKKGAPKTFDEVNRLLQAGKTREVKHIIRETAWPVDSSIRKQLWPVLCQQHAQDKSILEGFYWDMVNQFFGTTDLPDKPIVLPAFVDGSQCLYYHLTRQGKRIAERIVAVLGFACPDITYSPAVFPITCILLHFMSEEECYNCMTSLVAAKEKMFITQTKLIYEVTWRTAMQIMKKYVKSAAVHLQRHCQGGTKVDQIYQDWLWWIFQGLPFNHLVRVMDCYLHEGNKVLYRVAMAILVLFHKHSTASNSIWMQEITKNGVEAALNKFCEQIPVTPTKLLRMAFGVRALSSSTISRVFLKTEMLLKSRKIQSGSRQLVRSRSSENLPTSQSQVNVQMMSHTLTIKELLTMWSWLPVRITMYQPVLLYTTEEHGCSLRTFFVRVEQHEPTILLIKTFNNEIFGAYCSTRWAERNLKDDHGNRQAYFGTGETFLFSLYPERHKYQWVGIDGSLVNGKSFQHAAELFMAADNRMITIGGGEGQAIWMDENIRFGKSDRCLTFDNPPLCQSRDFEIRVLEVYGFSGV